MKTIIALLIVVTTSQATASYGNEYADYMTTLVYSALIRNDPTLLEGNNNILPTQKRKILIEKNQFNEMATQLQSMDRNHDELNFLTVLSKNISGSKFEVKNIYVEILTPPGTPKYSHVFSSLLEVQILCEAVYIMSPGMGGTLNGSAAADYRLKGFECELTHLEITPGRKVKIVRNKKTNRDEVLPL